MAMTAPAWDDRDMVAAMRARDPRGLTTVYDCYAGRLCNYSNAILRDPAAAQDVVHDAFLIAVERVEQLRDPTRLRPWLYAIVRNESLRHLSRRARTVDLDAAAHVPDDRVDVDAGLRAQELRDLVWTAAKGLNPREREVLELSVRQGLHGAELADALGVPLNHAHVLLSRARQQLERSMAVVVVARTGRRDCPALDALLDGWDGQLTALWRKRIARHIDRCQVCGATKRRRLNAAALFSALPAPIILPAQLRDRLLHEGLDTRAAAYRSQLAAQAAPFDTTGFPPEAPGLPDVGRPPRLPGPERCRSWPPSCGSWPSRSSHQAVCRRQVATRA